MDLPDLAMRTRQPGARTRAGHGLWLLVVQRQRIDPCRAPRQNVVGDERHHKKQRGDISHCDRIERRLRRTVARACPFDKGLALPESPMIYKTFTPRVQIPATNVVE